MKSFIKINFAGRYEILYIYILSGNILLRFKLIL